MSVEQIEATLLQLPREERRRFADWFYANEAEILSPQDVEAIHPEVQAEILRRRDELDANPGLAVPVTDEWFDDLKRKLADARARQAPAR
ncbi:MAG: hypothetical protein ACKODH_08335 [Limisphaerales bacterium]